jgi:high-affinity iron transporter
LNRKLIFSFILIAILSIATWSFWKHTPAVSNDSDDHSPRLLVHLLDYLAVDYGGAVKNGKVVSLPEYKEQLEFAQTVLELGQTLPEVKSSPEVQTLIHELNKLIHSKANVEKVAMTARLAQKQVISLSRLEVSPAVWPNLKQGKHLFDQTCSKCHGMEGRGDGPSSATLTTKPMNFQDIDKMKKMTPFQSFNTIRLGVPGTAMTAFPSYSDQDTWSLAFYILSLRYQPLNGSADLTKAFGKVEGWMLPETEELLIDVATSSDSNLEDKKGLLSYTAHSPEEKNIQLAALRLHSSSDTSQASLDLARLNIQGSMSDYRSGQFPSATKKALAAYVEGVEPIEPRLKANDPQAVLELEQLMGLVRAAINSRRSAEEVGLAGKKAIEALDKAAGLLRQQTPSAWLTFTLAFGVLLREGFEAVLLIVALLGVIRASGAQKARRWVHGGWMTAVALGIVAWFFSGWLMGISGISRELMEGITGSVTVAVLLYIGFWLHSRTETHRWRNFINVQVRAALDEKNLLELAFISFLAAFREAIETVLFLRAIWLEGGSDTKAALGLGVLCAFSAILLFGWMLLTFSAKVPIKSLFTISSGIMVLLSVILIGKAVHSFQEVDLLPISLSPLNLHFDWFGIYPTRETLFAQLLVLGFSVFLWIYGKKTPASKKQK